MKLFQDLPKFALEKIIEKTSFEDKANLLIASTSNENLRERLRTLCKIKRSKFCPFCILYIGTDYSESAGRRLLEDFHNQLLNSNSGDMNWEWKQNGYLYSIDERLDEKEFCIGYYSHGGKWVSDISSILSVENNHQRKLLQQQFEMLYNLENDDVISFETTDSLYSHILVSHSNFFQGQKSKLSIEAFKDTIWNMFISNSVFDFQNSPGSISRDEIFAKIHMNICSFFLVYVESLEEALAFRLEQDTVHLYFLDQLELLFEISQIAIKNMKFKFEKFKSVQLLSQIQKLLKLYSVLASILKSLKKFRHLH